MNKFSSNVTSTNTMPQLMAKLRSLVGNEALAGFDDRLHPESGEALGDVAANNEFGIKVTERPFMTDSHILFKTQKSRINNVPANVIYRNKKPREELRDLAEDMAQTIRDILDQGHFVVTTNDTPLIKTSFMRNNVLANVVKKTE